MTEVSRPAAASEGSRNAEASRELVGMHLVLWTRSYQPLSHNAQEQALMHRQGGLADFQREQVAPVVRHTILRTLSPLLMHHFWCVRGVSLTSTPSEYLPTLLIVYRFGVASSQQCRQVILTQGFT
jgi:hypothetical protein